MLAFTAMGSESSRLRQRILDLGRRYEALLRRILAERGPLIRGSFGARSRVCGKAGCRCTRGELHESRYLSATDGGRVRQVHVPVAEEEKVSAGVGRYRRFWQVRAGLAELNEQQLELIDELGRSLLDPYPPDRPLPAARHRGPRPRGEGHEPS